MTSKSTHQTAQALALTAACAVMQAAGDGPGSAVVPLGIGVAGRVLAPERLAWLESEYHVYLEVLDRGGPDRMVAVRITRPANSGRPAAAVAADATDDIGLLAAVCSAVARSGGALPAATVLLRQRGSQISRLPLAELERAYGVSMQVLDGAHQAALPWLRIERTGTPLPTRPDSEPDRTSRLVQFGRWLRRCVARATRAATGPATRTGHPVQ